MAIIETLLNNLNGLFGHGYIVMLCVFLLFVIFPLMLYLPPLFTFVIISLVLFLFGLYTINGIPLLSDPTMILFVIIFGLILGYIYFRFFIK